MLVPKHRSKRLRHSLLTPRPVSRLVGRFPNPFENKLIFLGRVSPAQRNHVGGGGILGVVSVSHCVVSKREECIFFPPPTLAAKLAVCNGKVGGVTAKLAV